MIGIRSHEFAHTDETLFENIEFFKDCYNKDLSAYKALLFLIDYLDPRRNEK